MHTKTLEITKSKRGWSIHTQQYWSDWPKPVSTHSGASTLAWAIYQAVHWASQNDTKVTSITVKGKPYPKDKAIAAILQATDNMLAHTREDTLNALAI